MYKKIEKTVGSLKFAVIIILIFTIEMIIGTFLESYYGTEFAGRVMYKTWWFMLTQFFMGLSILFAAFLRLPPKKRLYGFYTIHSGLIILAIGSFVTYYAGVDGSLTLYPNEPGREVLMPQDILKISIPDNALVVTKELPNAAFETNLDLTWKEFNFKTYYPYADKKLNWRNTESSEDKTWGHHSGQYLLANPNFEQEVTLSRHPKTKDFQASAKLGPLQILYLPSSLADCFKNLKPSSYFVYNIENKKCFFEGKHADYELHFKELNTGKKVLIHRKISAIASDDLSTGITTFFPNISPLPLDKNLQIKKSSFLRSFMTDLFEKSPTLFIFGEKVAFFDETEEKWIVKEFKSKSDSIALPWMEFELNLLKHVESGYPYYQAVPVLPIQKNNQMVKGATRAVRFEVRDQIYTVTDTQPISLLIDGKKVLIELTKKTLKLPFELVLTRFKMDKNPGTNNPASYESFVNVFTDKGSTEHHVFMNNPLKFQGFTFYQASYAQDRQGNYVSTLSVNIDQGRVLKYLGSILLVLGAIWHFRLNRKKSNKKNKNQLIANRDGQPQPSEVL